MSPARWERPPRDDAERRRWERADAKLAERIAPVAGLPPTTPIETLAEAYGEAIREQDAEVPDLPVFELPEAAEPPASLRDITGFGDVWVAIDREALATVQSRAEASGRLMAELGRLVGVQTTDPAVLVAAVNEALAEAAELPAGAEVVPADELAKLRADAELGRSSAVDAELDAAVREGRIPAAHRAGWAEDFRMDPADARARLERMPRGRVPVATIGYSDDPAPGDPRAEAAAEAVARVTPRPGSE